MAKSVRISDSLYEAATVTAGLMQRSLAQQVEHWALLGQAFEKSATTEEVMAASLRRMHEKDAASVKTGTISATALHAIPPDFVAQATMRLPAKALKDFDADR